MCGRFTLTTNDYLAVAQALHAYADPDLLSRFGPRYNVAPTDPHWIVCHESDQRQLVPGAWTYGAGDRLLINARSETADQKRAYADAFFARRCAVPVDGFYEWTGPRNDRRPVWFHRPDRSIFAFAGLYQEHMDRSTGEVQRRFTILTTTPNDVVAPYHDRMPVILPREDLDAWLTVRPNETRATVRERAQSLFLPIAPEFLVATPVSKRASDPRNDDPSCLEPPEPGGPEQQSLF